MDFCKMNGIGNDYIFVYQQSATLGDPGYAAKRLSNRQTGIGSDGLVLMEQSAIADFSMRIFNADGSEATMCGNAIRCVGRYVFDKGLTQKRNLQIETGAGVRTLQLLGEGNQVSAVLVDMGEPMLLKRDGEAKLYCPFPTTFGVQTITFVWVGNPHAVIFVREFDKNTLAIAKEIATSQAIDGGINVEMVRVDDRNTLSVLVWERGSGATEACGTGACAAVYAAIRRELVSNQVSVHLPGGALLVQYLAEQNKLTMQGGADYNYEGRTFLLQGENGTNGQN